MDANPMVPLNEPEPTTRSFYLDAMGVLDRAEVPFVVGGGYAMACHTGIARNTKDLDVFVRPADRHRALDALAAAGYKTEWTWPHFLCKAVSEPAFMDILFNSGNGLCPVDDQWFEYATDARILGHAVKLCPPEEMIWSKAFVQSRDRYDGADIAHLILARGPYFDWERLLRRFRTHERVILAHLLLFGYIFPSEAERVPQWTIDRLLERIDEETPTEEPVCRGTFLAQNDFIVDVRQRGFHDARLLPRGPLTSAEIATITAR